MALSVNSVFEVHTGGLDTNGGGFVTGASGTDYSLVDAKRTATGSNDSTTDAVAVGTGVITLTTAAFTSAIVGNIIYLQGGTGSLTAGWYQVTVFTSATSITVDRNVAAGTGITMNIGGALLSVGMTGGVGAVAGNVIYVKAGTYTISSASNNVTGGVVSSTNNVVYVGYSTNRTLTNSDTRPLINFGTSGITLFAGFRGIVRNIQFDGNGQTTAAVMTGSGLLFYCTIADMNVAHTGCAMVACYVTECTAAIVTTGAAFGCEFTANTATPVALSVGGYIVDSLVWGNTGATTDGVTATTTTGCLIQNVTSYGNGRDGFRIASHRGLQLVNCIAEGNAGSQFNNNSVAAVYYLNCASQSAIANTVGSSIGQSFITLSGDPFTNAAGGDFSLNTTAGAGAALRAAGFPGTFTGGTTTGYLDVGAVQHQDPAGGSGAKGRYLFTNGGVNG